MYSNTKAEQLLEMARQEGVLRARDARKKGFHPEFLRRLCANGALVRVGRGLYMSAESDITANHTLAETAKRVPNGVICLLSALRFHDIGTQIPHEVWVAIDRKAQLPRVDGLLIKTVRFSGRALTDGVEEYEIDSVKVRIYGPAKTVADCFKYRNKIGLDAAVEALRECRRRRKATVDDIWMYAKICRVANVIRPYLEATS